MCNACGFVCCAWDGFEECGCDGCHEPKCWTVDDDNDEDIDDAELEDDATTRAKRLWLTRFDRTKLMKGTP